MPTAPSVPTLETERIRSRPLSIPRQQPDLRVAQAGAQVVDALQKAEVQRSQIRLSEAEGEAIRRWNAVSYENDDAYFKLQGKVAVESLDDRYKVLDDITSDISESGLRNDTEKRVFADALRQRRELMRIKMAMHSFDERQRWDKETALANIIAQTESAANDSSVENLRLTRARIEDEAKGYAKADGMGEEATNVYVQLKVSHMYRKAIEGTLGTDLTHARELFERFGDQLSSDDRTAVRKQLREFGFADDSRVLMAEAVSVSDSLEDQLTFIDRKFGPKPDARQREVIERARSKATVRDNQIASAQGRQRSEDFNFLGNLVIEAARDGSTNVIEGLQKFHPDKFENLSTEQRAALERLAVSGVPKRTTAKGWRAYTEIMLLAGSNEAALADPRFDPMMLQSEMATEQYTTIVKLISDARGIGLRGDSKQAISDQARITAKAKLAHIDDDDVEFQLLNDEVQERREEWLRLKKVPPDPSEFQQIIDDALIKIILPGGSPGFLLPLGRSGIRVGGDKDKFAFELGLTDIPADDRQSIRLGFAELHGRAPETNEIIDTYVLGRTIPADARAHITRGLKRTLERDPTEAEIVLFFTELRQRL